MLGRGLFRLPGKSSGKRASPRPRSPPEQGPQVSVALLDREPLHVQSLLSLAL
jgi:hypothetical protein